MNRIRITAPSPGVGVVIRVNMALQTVGAMPVQPANTKTNGPKLVANLVQLDGDPSVTDNIVNIAPRAGT